MDTPAYTVVRTARTEMEADRVVAALMSAGFHPADLEASSHFEFAGEEAAFRIEVPAGEANAASEFLKTYIDPESED
jgi:hypothetical protein